MVDPRSSDSVLWVDGAVVAATERVLRPDDHALVGDGVFEAIKVVDGVPFALHLHLDRLEASAEPLGLPIDRARISHAVDTLMATEQAKVSPSWLRITVTGGSAPMGTGGVGSTPTIVAAVAPMARWPPTSSVVVVPWTRNERAPTAGLKTISYADNVIALRHARRHGADEAIFANTVGELCEGTGTNVFVATGGRLVTPPLTSGCLAGITRRLLLEWCPEIEESPIAISALAGADEVFLTSTSRDVHPVREIDGRVLPAAPGPFTRAAMDAWTQHASRLR